MLTHHTLAFSELLLCWSSILDWWCGAGDPLLWRDSKSTKYRPGVSVTGLPEGQWADTQWDTSAVKFATTCCKFIFTEHIQLYHHDRALSSKRNLSAQCSQTTFTSKTHPTELQSSGCLSWSESLINTIICGLLQFQHFTKISNLSTLYWDIKKIQKSNWGNSGVYEECFNTYHCI